MTSEPLTRDFFHWYVSHSAWTVGGTEAFVFGIQEAGGKQSLHLIVHIRPDNSTEEVKMRARKAFVKIALPCIEERKDGAIEYVVLNEKGDPRFCLVVLLYDASGVEAPVGVMGVIVRCPTKEDAAERFQKLYQASGPKPKRESEP